jgi:hypothetical protein
MPKTEILVKSTAELLTSFHAENARIHSLEPDGDVIKTARSILYAGWCELPSYNTSNGKLIGGHGRVLAAEWLMQQNKGWFAAEWAAYQAIEPNPKPAVKERFTSGYWLKVPVMPSELDEPLHKAAMVRLNNTEARGVINEGMKAAILSRLKPAAQEVAMPDPEQRAAFLSRFTERVSAAAATPEAQAAAAEHQEAIEQVEAVMMSFEARDEEDEDEDVLGAEDEDDDAIDDDPEPEVTEGGAQFNADAPDRKQQTQFPICVILSHRRWEQLEAWKQKIGITSDQATLKHHAAFQDEAES